MKCNGGWWALGALVPGVVRVASEEVGESGCGSGGAPLGDHGHVSFVCLTGCASAVVAAQIRYQRTVGGLQITTFVKETRTPSDFYALALAPYYKADLFCQTWLNG